MKKFVLTVMFVCLAVNMASCAEDECVPCGAGAAPEVYLEAKSVNVSSFDITPDWAPLPRPEALTDGNLLTRWSSDYQGAQWVSLDFVQPKVLSKMIIFWEAAYAVDYDILTSLDGENWQVLLSLKDQDGEIDELKFAPSKIRYVKIMTKKRFNPQWGVSIWELLCFGPGEGNFGEKPLSSVYPQITSRLSEKEEDQPELEIEKPQAPAGAVSLDEFHKGINYTSWSRLELGSESSDQTLKHLKKLGVNYLSIMVVWYQEDIDTNIISPDLNDTPDDRALVHAINEAHSLGMKVMLKPHVDIKTDQWRGDIIPSEEWFASYRNFMFHYGRLAAQYNVELFSIGTELVNITMPKWQGHWEKLISDFREIYPGYLSYSANWDEYSTVDFWDKLDFIGIDAYFPLTAKNDPTREELIAGWKKHAKDIDDWYQTQAAKKPVLFTEIGYCSADGTNTKPWAVLTNLSEGCIDQEEQASCLDAMLTASSEYSWFNGFYWWNYFPQERWSPLGYTIRRKEAEEILAIWLKKL